MHVRTANIPRNYPPQLCDITHQCFADKKLKNLKLSGIYSIYIDIILHAGTSIYASSSFNLALWGQNPAGAKILPPKHTI